MTRSEKLKYFTDWYLNYEHTPESLKQNANKLIANYNFDTVMSWKEEPEIQENIKDNIKNNYIYDLAEVYESMKKKALEGDVQSAKFIMDFCKSDLFKNSKSEIDKILDGLRVD